METEKSSNSNSIEAQTQPAETLDYQEQVDQKKRERQLGAKILSRANFETRHQPIVESSLNKAHKKGERLPGKNSERRNYSYLNRIESLVDKYGNHLEKRLWNRSADKLIISPENITDDYWHIQEQILRDNGQGHTLSDREKQILIDDIRKTQRESLKSWSNYLGSEESPYPMWFKVYAWDGMSKMGVFDKEKQQFAKRDKHTVAPYPRLNPAALAKVYGVISDFYNQPDESRYDENLERDIELEALVKSGNFNKLYSKILLSEKAIPKTPERTEDIHGKWVEYLPGEEEKLAAAAEGTPWCIADPGTGRNYLEHGTYDEWYDDEYDEYDDDENNKAKFILFHLRDPETNTLSSSACASIRLKPDGKVAEISGLNEGQALEDSLVPIVEEKVRSLPGGEEFLEAFADKKQLIALDRKMQNGEYLTKEELEFLYELNRPIKTLDTYADEDPRIKELKKQYGLDYALRQGVDPGQIVMKDGYWAAQHLDDLISSGADINQLVPLFSNYRIVDHLEDFISHGADIDIITSCLKPDDIIENIDILNKHQADIDINEIASKLTPGSIIKHYDILSSHGVNVDMDEIVAKLGPWETLLHSNELDEIGVDYGSSTDLLYGLVHDPKSLRAGYADIWESFPEVLSDMVKNLDIDDVIQIINSGIERTHTYNILNNYHPLDQADIERLTSELEPRASRDFQNMLPSLQRNWNFRRNLNS